MRVTLENVWEALKGGQWESKTNLGEISGVDQDTLTRMIYFLDRWDFVDVRRGPELLVRRKTTAISPIETFQLLRSVTKQPAISRKPTRIAQRVACRKCGGRQLTITGQNEVECVTCHESQWYTLEGSSSFVNRDQECNLPTKPTGLQRMLIRLGFPQRTFRANVPNSTQYFWFRCTACGGTSADYPHGHSKYLTCQQCETRTQFW